MNGEAPDTERYLSEAERLKLSKLVVAHEGSGGLSKLAENVKLSDLALARAGAGWECQRGTITQIRNYLQAVPDVG